MKLPSCNSLEERKEVCELKYSPEEYMDRVWAENQEEQEEDKQHSQNELDEGHSGEKVEDVESCGDRNQPLKF